MRTIRRLFYKLLILTGTHGYRHTLSLVGYRESKEKRLERELALIRWMHENGLGE